MTKQGRLGPSDYVLIEQFSDLDLLSSGQSAQIVSGTAHIHAECARRGIASIAVDTLVSGTAEHDLFLEIAHALNGLEKQDWPISHAERAAVLLELTRHLFREAMLRRLSHSLGAPIQTLRPQTAPDFVRPPARTRWLLPRNPRAYDLEFRSFTGLKLSAQDRVRQIVEVKSFGGPSVVRAMHNFRNGVSRNRDRARFRYRMRSPSDFQLSECLNVDADWRESLHDVAAQALGGHRHYRELLGNLFQRIGPPENAHFNVVSDVVLSGFADAVQTAGGVAYMSSHGCLVKHGSAARQVVSGMLGRAVFNSFPAMQILEPRSPLQARSKYPGQEVRSKRHVSEYVAPQGEDSSVVRVLYAPNFRTWMTTYHGMTATCFETRDCIQALCGALAGDPRFELRIRLKTTPGDVASERTLENHARGLLPEDVGPALEAAGNISDASLGSHKEELSRADLVLTEGLTAVMFEAMELRKPVILLRKSGRSEPSLPAWDAATLASRDGRNPAYFLTTEDNLARCLFDIAQRHRSHPLEDEELADYVWV